MSKFGQIPTDVICRFSELTKTEIIVLCYLYSARNKTTERCNPSRGDISRKVGIAKPHISVAVKGLIKKQRIVELKDGSFHLKSTNAGVTDFVTVGVTNSVTVGVTDFDKRVTDSVTRGYENRNSDTIYDLNRQGTYIEQREDAPFQPLTKKNMNPTSEHAVSSLIASFPEIQFTPAQLGYIEADIQDTPADREAWDSILTLYKRNYDPATGSYIPTKIGTFLEMVKKEKKRLQKNGINKSNKRTDADVFAESAEFYANYPDPIA